MLMGQHGTVATKQRGASPVSATPQVFVSYSYDDDAHIAWVLQLATDLRADGIDVSIDEWDLEFGQDTIRFMEQSISNSDRVLMVCTPRYVERSNERKGGAGYEGLIVTSELFENIDSIKFIPVLRNNPNKVMPTALGRRMYADFNDDAAYSAMLKK